MTSFRTKIRTMAYFYFKVSEDRHRVINLGRFIASIVRKVGE